MCIMLHSALGVLDTNSCRAIYKYKRREHKGLTVTRASRTKRSSDCAVRNGSLKFKEGSLNDLTSDWLHNICFRNGI